MVTPSQVALITGAANVVGERIARELLGRDWVTIVQGADGEEVSAAAEALSAAAEAPGQVAAFRADLADADDRERLVEFVLDEFGRIDLLVCAESGPPASEDLLELTQQAYAQVMEACVTGPLFLVQHVANEMVRLTEAGQVEAGKIVLVNSIGAYTTSTDRTAHCLAAAAAAMLTRLLADRLSEHGINVYEVRAGLISTGGSDEVHARYDRLIHEGLTPIRRWGRPQDIALAVVAVAENMLPYSTGEVINVDGGFHLRRL